MRRHDGSVESKEVPEEHIRGAIPQSSSFPWATELVAGGIDCKASRLDHDEVLVFLDGTDSRKKAFYAPFDYYDPYDPAYHDEDEPD
jgi:hypothetical protein